MIELPFQHRTSGNCETGVMCNLLKNQGLEISENLLFGIGAGLFFIYVPFINHGEHGPITAYRYTPGAILKRAARTLNLPLEIATYASPQKAAAALDDKIRAGQYVGITGDIYYFEVAPEFSNIHFFGHNVIVYGFNDVEYLVSDPIVQTPIKVSKTNMELARFTKGKQNPKGKMYWFEQEVGKQQLDLPTAIKRGLKVTTRRMLNPIPFFGVKGMKKLANDLAHYPEKKSDKFAKHHLNSMIRQIEFLGSGGSGFRKQFGSFLEESAQILQHNGINEMANKVKEEIVPAWRHVSIDMVKCYREPVQEAKDAYQTLAQNILQVAQLEQEVFQTIKRFKL